MNSRVQNLLIILTLVSMESSHLVIFVTSGKFITKFNVLHCVSLSETLFWTGARGRMSITLSLHLMQLLPLLIKCVCVEFLSFIKLKKARASVLFLWIHNCSTEISYRPVILRRLRSVIF